MISRKEIVAQLLAECADDHVGLWEVVRAVQDEMDVRDPSELREVTLDVVRDLLDQPCLEAGFPAPDGRRFNPWNISKEDVLKRVEHQWDALGRLPNIGDIVWFSQEGPHASIRS